jgi:hypothetical protein
MKDQRGVRCWMAGYMRGSSVVVGVEENSEAVAGRGVEDRLGSGGRWVVGGRGTGEQRVREEAPV